MGGRVLLFPRVYAHGGAAEGKHTAIVSATFSVLQRGAAVHEKSLVVVVGGVTSHTSTEVDKTKRQS